MSTPHPHELQHQMDPYYTALATPSLRNFEGMVCLNMLNSLTAMDARERPLNNELHW